jgi:hypothetical protein
MTPGGYAQRMIARLLKLLALKRLFDAFRGRRGGRR